MGCAIDFSRDFRFSVAELIQNGLVAIRMDARRYLSGLVDNILAFDLYLLRT